MIRSFKAAVAALLLLVLSTVAAHATASGAIVCTGVSANFQAVTCPDINEEIANVDRQGLKLLSSVSGTNTITANTSPYALAAYTDGLSFRLKPAVQNTSTVTLNINGLGAKALVKQTGTALASADLLTTTIYVVQYYAADDHFRVMGAVGSVGTDDDVPEAADFTNLTGGTGIVNSPTGTVAFSFTDKGSDVSLGADECVFTSNATVAGYIVCEGDTANTIESRIAVTDPTSTDKTFLIPDANSYPIVDKDYGDITVSASGQTWSVDADSIALGTDTTNNYVATVADGTGIDGTCSAEGCTFTPTLDLTEISSLTWGAGAFTAMTFDAGAVDPALTISSGQILFTAGGTAPIIGIDDQGPLRFFEEDAGGSNYIEFVAPAAIGTNRQCILVDGGAPIPDSCVGDGTDAGSAGGIANVVEDLTPQLGGGLDLNTFDITGTGNVNVTGDLQSSDDVIVGDDLTFATGAVVNWNASDCLLTHSANTLALTGGCTITSDSNISIGTTGVLSAGTIELGAASDTTIARSAAGTLTVEGVGIVRGATGGTDNSILRADGTGGTLAQNSALVIADTSGAISGAASGFSIEFFGASGTDSTLTAPSAGDLNIEGNRIYRAGGTDVALADGGTGASLVDPNADRFMFWDDSAGATAYLTPNAPITITTTSVDIDAATTSADGSCELATTAEAATQTDTTRCVTPQGLAFKPESFCVAASDETSNLTTGTAKIKWRMPYAFTVTAVRASLSTVATGASLLTVDLNEGGTTIISTKLTFDASESTTTTAATPAVISDSTLADDAEMSVDIDQVGNTTTGRGLKVCVIGHQ